MGKIYKDILPKSVYIKGEQEFENNPTSPAIRKMPVKIIPIHKLGNPNEK